MADRIELAADETILFIGDSITDAGRREVGVDGLGQGYVFFAGNLLLARHRRLNLNIINKGVNGDTTRSLTSVMYAGNVCMPQTTPVSSNARNTLSIVFGLGRLIASSPERKTELSRSLLRRLRKLATCVRA